MTARCFATLALINSSIIMDLIIQTGVKMLQTIEDVIQRQGAAELCCCVVNKLQFKIVPYVTLLVVPLLGNSFSDNNCKFHSHWSHFYRTNERSRSSGSSHFDALLCDTDSTDAIGW